MLYPTVLIRYYGFYPHFGSLQALLLVYPSLMTMHHCSPPLSTQECVTYIYYSSDLRRVHTVTTVTDKPQGVNLCQNVSASNLKQYSGAKGIQNGLSMGQKWDKESGMNEIISK